MSLENQEIPKTPFHFIAYVSRDFKFAAIVATLFIVVASAVSQSSVYAFKVIVDAAERGEVVVVVVTALLYPGIIFASQTIFRIGGHHMRTWILGAMKVSNDVLLAHMLHHSHTYFSERFVGSLVSKINNAGTAVDTLVREMLWSHLSAIVTLLVTFYFLLTIDGNAALILFALVVVLIIVNQKIAPKKALLSKQSAAMGTKLRGGLSDVISNVQAVRQYANKSEENERVMGLSTSYKTAQYENWEFSEKTLFYNGVILFLFTLAMFWILVTGWNQGTVETSELILALTLYSQIGGMLMFIGRAINTTARTVGELEEALEEVLIEPEIVDAPNAKPLVVVEGKIKFSAVHFSFQNMEVFNDFSLQVSAGQRIGLVGHSGAGKTTFVSLLLRQHDIESGKIEIDNQNIAEVTQDSLRQNIAVVPQEPLLFHRTIRENIAYGNTQATTEQIEEAAKKAQAHEFITSLPEGYDTLVGERGIKLSGGQKQRVAIARAILKDAPILVLDEATSALDSESEVAIQKALEKLMEGKTVIAVAHRLSTLRKMDRIIVLEDGKIIEDGTHDNLTSNGGVYQKLWEHQAGGFLIE